ncbi:MAG: hypothetical protein ACD_79C00991G0002 [uncultured bacterium]|nr:MAG: hypothetical protein ACD_79C00991G0002 [uncultured bacterium]
MNDLYNRSKKKLFISCLLLSLILIIVGKTKKDFPLKRFLNDSFSPLFSSISSITHQTKETLWALFHFYKLKKENQALTDSLSEMNKTTLENKQLKLENGRLNELLSFKSQLRFETIPARIIGHNFSNWYKSLIINKGSRDGILLNQAVLSSSGIVGKICEVFNTTSKVMLISDQDSRIGAQILRTRDIGVLEGLNKDTCIINYLSRKSNIRKGDFVITSGFHGLFPKGLMIGTISNIFNEDFGLYKYAEVVLSVDHNKLEEVLVITDKQIYSEQENDSIDNNEDLTF